MSQNSSIEWTDATWNPVRGCVKVSPGCAHCYAEAFAERFRGVKGHPYEQGFDLRLVPEKLKEPLSWKKPRRVFVNSMSDLFQDGVPDSYLDSCFAVMACAQRHTFQVLTKRPDRMRDYLLSRAKSADYWKKAARELGWALEWEGISLVWYPLPNVIVGASIENDNFAQIRFPILCDLGERGWSTMVSMEPLLSAVTVPDRYLALGKRAWVIVGGESGHGARPFGVGWAQSIIQQCRSASVRVFLKQLGANPDWSGYAFPDLALKSRKGGNPDEWPRDLRVREFPADRV